MALTTAATDVHTLDLDAFRSRTADLLKRKATGFVGLALVNLFALALSPVALVLTLVPSLLFGLLLAKW
jgi:hypothetical protein